jgi:oxygen-independent coproporphyrinogen III oxidase
MTRLEEMLAGTPYAGYAYAYPHKTAYRRLTPPVPLREVWAADARDALFLYLHVPFCDQRCGFCNLFTTAHPGEAMEVAYLRALRREAVQVREAIGPLRIARMAIGGGTPTYLDPEGLETLFDLASELFGVDPCTVPISVETSPSTATEERLAVLQQRGVERVSIGVQSFIDSEAAAAGRHQRVSVVEAALERIRAAGIPTLNIDLIYGLPGQTVQSWLVSLRAALRYAPDELYLYPLYVRPLTGLGRRGVAAWDEQRLACYRAGREFLLEAGYRQLSMRLFRQVKAERHVAGAQAEAALSYCCQGDGMVGLGCGARSYTRRLHYSREYAVGRQGVREVLNSYLERSPGVFSHADYGVRLDAEEQKRRYVIKSLLRVEGLSRSGYGEHTASEALEDLPELAELVDHGLAECDEAVLRLTERGLEHSDTIGPWLYSEDVRRRSEAFDLR